MQVAYTIWTWLLDPYDSFKKPEDKAAQKVATEKALREIAFLGYDTVENFNIVVDTYGDEPEELRALLDKYNLAFGAVYHYLKTDFEAEMEMARRCIAFLKAMDCDILNLQAPKKAPEGNTPGAVLETARKADIMGALCAENGIKLCMHPHWGSTVETEEEIALFAENTDPAKVRFCLDTAHTQLMGMESAEMVRRYAGRLEYVHLKDVDPDVSVSPERPMNRFCALGQGTVDFKGVKKALDEVGYNGVLCVELDYPKICNYQSAETSRRYIHEVLGL